MSYTSIGLWNYLNFFLVLRLVCKLLPIFYSLFNWLHFCTKNILVWYLYDFWSIHWALLNRIKISNNFWSEIFADCKSDDVTFLNPRVSSELPPMIWTKLCKRINYWAWPIIVFIRKNMLPTSTKKLFLFVLLTLKIY